MRAVADDEAKRLTADADRRLRALNSSVVNGAKKQAAPPEPRRGATRGIAFIVACVALFLWGFHRGTSVPDGRWLLAVLLLGAFLAAVVLAGRSYRRSERRSAAYTEKIQGRLKQYQGTDRYQDGT